MATWTYDGATTATATFATVAGHSYRFLTDDPDSAVVSGTGTGSPLTLTVTGIGGLDDTESFYADVLDETASQYVAATLFRFGTAGEHPAAVSVSYDGAGTVTYDAATFAGSPYVFAVGRGDGRNAFDDFTGAGGVEHRVFDFTSSGFASGDILRMYFQRQDDPGLAGSTDGLGVVTSYETPLTVTGTDDGGGPAVVAGLVSIAFLSSTLDGDPLWQGVDAEVVSWQIDRGRQSETDTTQTGTAQITLVDSSGVLDTLNALGPYYGDLQSLKQVRIQETDPRDGVTVVTQYTGFIEDWDWTLDQASRQLQITISCVDLFDVLAATEVVPDATGQAWYARQQVDDAIRARLADAGVAPTNTDVFTGNVYVKPVIYQPGTDSLTTLHDCADAEFPGVSNIYISKTGRFTFHGRYARFNPFDPSYGIGVWSCGDAVGAAGHDDWGKVSELAWQDAKSKIVNACLATPEGIASVDVAGQLVDDPTSIDDRGTRSLKFEGLLTDGNVNTGTTDLQETKLFAHYYVDNGKTPLPQITKLTFKGRDPADPTESGTWNILLHVEIGDVISVVTVNPGHGGFNAAYFVEGIHQTAEIGDDRQLQRTCTLDVSPQALYDTSPFVTSGSLDVEAPTVPADLVATAV